MTLKWGSSHIIPVSHSLAVHSADDVTIDWRWHHNNQTIVLRTWDKWYLNRKISILFMAIFMAGHVRIINHTHGLWFVLFWLGAGQFHSSLDHCTGYCFSARILNNMGKWMITWSFMELLSQWYKIKLQKNHAYLWVHIMYVTFILNNREGQKTLGSLARDSLVLWRGSPCLMMMSGSAQYWIMVILYHRLTH